MHPELEPLIEAAIADGVITDKERVILHKKATALGVDVDELDMLVDARLFKHLEAKAVQPVDEASDIGQAKESSGNCGGCGAPANPALLTCEFCGVLIGDVDSADDELKAVRELVKSAQNRVDGISDKFERTQAAAAFWGSAYTPQTGPALLQMAKQVLAYIDPTHHVEWGNANLATRTKGLLRDAKMLGDPEVSRKAGILEESLAEVMAQYAARTKEETMYGLIFAIVLIGGLVIWLFV